MPLTTADNKQQIGLDAKTCLQGFVNNKGTD